MRKLAYWYLAGASCLVAPQLLLQVFLLCSLLRSLLSVCLSVHTAAANSPSFLQTRSKSLSDIPLVCPARKPPGGTAADEGGLDAGTAGEWEGEDGQRRLTTARDTEAQWQDVSPVQSTRTMMICCCCLWVFVALHRRGQTPD